MDNQEKPDSNNATQPNAAPAQASTGPEFTIDSVEDGDKEEKLDAIKDMRTRGIIGLIFGSSTIIGSLIFAGIFNANAGTIGGALVGFAAFMVYGGLTLIAIPVTVALLIASIVEKKKYNLPFTSHIGMSIAGVILACSPYIYAGIQGNITSLIQETNPYRVTGTTMNMFKCQQFATRAQISNASKTDAAEDALCSYLEYLYNNQAFPMSGEQIVHNEYQGKTEITIDSDQPESEDVYNIVTHKNCARDSKEDNRKISVWYRDKNNLSCVSMNKQIDIYQMPPTEDWYENLFYSENDNED